MREGELYNCTVYTNLYETIRRSKYCVLFKRSLDKHHAVRAVKYTIAYRYIKPHFLFNFTVIGHVQTDQQFIASIELETMPRIRFHWL